jgi:hypothetical protein
VTAGTYGQRLPVNERNLAPDYYDDFELEEDEDEEEKEISVYDIDPVLGFTTDMIHVGYYMFILCFILAIAWILIEFV